MQTQQAAISSVISDTQVSFTATRTLLHRPMQRSTALNSKEIEVTAVRIKGDVNGDGEIQRFQIFSFFQKMAACRSRYRAC
ncbi:hypothetical protein [Ruminococcus flavefaciens]|uniref:hypothetical protein n=1 Tax=Ruminococcus flavefaciens TaxID=1265 RepID=UPI0012BB8C31|nr:hypothetical protein [Ruminococcus flavefaciens]